MSLLQLARGYLEAEGYDVAARRERVLVGNRQGVGGSTEFIHVWVIEEDDSERWRSHEATLLKQFAEATEIHPSSQKFLLVPSLSGITSQFRQGAKRWYNIQIRVPVQFFDTLFRWEVSPDAASASKQLKERGEEALRWRTPQPFLERSTDNLGDDLLEHLVRKLRHPGRTGGTLNFIIGPAGIGKSILFDSLFARLFSQFTADKRSQELSARPMPLVPGYEYKNDTPTVQALVMSFLRSDFARPLDPQVFNWMLTNGTATWLVDGLDEVIAHDPGFFDYLLDLMTLPGQTTLPSVVVCIRDSLLATNDDFREFCDSNSEFVHIYELQKWGDPSKRRFARLNLGDAGEEFMSYLRERPEANELASTPYYCQVLIDLFKDDGLTGTTTEDQVLSHALEHIIEREFAKDLFDRAFVSEAQIQEFIEALALEDFSLGFQGIPVEDVRELAEAVLPAEAEGWSFDRSVGQFTQIALVSSTPLGKVQFSQEVMEQYVLGLGLIGSLEQRPDAFRRHLAYRQVPSEWLTLRIVADHVSRKGRFGQLGSLLFDAINQPAAFKNLLQIATMVDQRPDSIFPKNLTIERQDLSGIAFKRCDFRGLSLRGCDLSDTSFDDCDLRGTALEDAILKNTDLSGVELGRLKGIRLGDLVRLYSVKVAPNRTLSNPSEVRNWLEGVTGEVPEIVEPCAAAQQLRYLFSKFIRPNGQARRSWLDRRGTLAGRRILDPQAVLTSTIRFRYLTEDSARDRIVRPEGDLYAEIVNYVKDLTLTRGLRELLSEACERPGCVHVPAPR